MTLEITLLGRPQIKLDGQIAPAINANKALALLYYLAATGQTHSRQALAGLLWSDLPEEAARRNLRVELNRLTTVFDAYLLRSRETLAFNLDLPHRLDLALFESILKHPDPTSEQLRTAIDLYQGDFLEDFHVRDAALFEEWQHSQRGHLRQAVQRLTMRLVQRYVQEGEYASAINYAQQLLAREPWLEEGHQQLMVLYTRTGQRGAALAQYEACSQALEDEYGVPPSDETNDLYDRILAGEIAVESGVEIPPSAVLTPPRPTAPPFQAPAPLLHFVGREDELAELRAAILQAADSPVVAVVGMGGVGKSTFAIHLAHALKEEFPEGVLWAHVATSDPLDVLSQWARAFGYDFSSLADVENRAAALRGVLAEKRVLLVLDDVRSVARTRPLLAGGPRCATLLTTRDLDVATALNARPHRLSELTPEASLRLLTRILGEERVAAELEAAKTLCTLLQHLPLAVEITAQRLVSRPRRRLADMADRLRHVEERLDLSISDRAVRTSFQVSWEALDANLRRTFALLGVFEGRSFAADAVAHLAGLDRYTAEDRLFALTALSLVGEETTDRYRQHPLLADFAAEQLGENKIPFVDVALYYQKFAEQNRTNYAALRPEWENLMAGMETAHRLQQWPLVLDYAESLTQAWFTRARYTQARHGYLLAIRAAQSLEERQVEAELRLRLGEACLEQNDYAEAKSVLLEGLRLYQLLEEGEGIAAACFLLGRLAVEQGDYTTAEQMLHVSRELREELNEPMALAATLYQAALLAYRRSAFEEAQSECERALGIQEQSGDLAGSLPTLRLLADLAVERKVYSEAESYLNRCLALCQQLQERGELTATYYSLAVVTRFQDKTAEAHAYIDHALTSSEWMGNRQFQAMALYEQFLLHRKRQEIDAAQRAGQRSRTLFQSLQDHYNLIFVLDNLAKFAQEQNLLDEARLLWLEAFDLAAPIEHPLTPELRNRVAAKDLDHHLQQSSASLVGV
jgi:DNA-binding SARP family transcriptional activator/tetratricopeptide (TPR) repeat protein